MRIIKQNIIGIILLCSSTFLTLKSTAITPLAVEKPFIFSFKITKQLNPVTSPKSVETKFPDAKAYINKKITYTIINTANNTFGYDIYANGKMMIHQPSIPAVKGNEGFKTRAAAEKVAKLAVAKINKGQMPPTITIAEMQQLKAIPQ